MLLAAATSDQVAAAMKVLDKKQTDRLAAGGVGGGERAVAGGVGLAGVC